MKRYLTYAHLPAKNIEEFAVLETFLILYSESMRKNNSEKEMNNER